MQLTVNQLVVGSIPACGAKYPAIVEVKRLVRIPLEDVGARPTQGAKFLVLAT